MAAILGQDIQYLSGRRGDVGLPQLRYDGVVQEFTHPLVIERRQAKREEPRGERRDLLGILRLEKPLAQFIRRAKLRDPRDDRLR